MLIIDSCSERVRPHLALIEKEKQTAHAEQHPPTASARQPAFDDSPVTADALLNHYKKTQPAALAEKADHWYCYALVRGDLKMPLGKLGSQVGHAFDYLADLAQAQSPERKAAYRSRVTGGSKVVLKSKNQSQLIATYNAIRALGIPASLVIDSEHVLLPHFTGEPVITAIGIGPCQKAEVQPLLKKFNCV